VYRAGPGASGASAPWGPYGPAWGQVIPGKSHITHQPQSAGLG
jgi:hypothetical protein